MCMLHIMVIYSNKEFLKDYSLFELNNSNFDEKMDLKNKFDNELEMKNEVIHNLNQELNLKNDEIFNLNQKINQFKDRKSVKWADKINKLIK